MTPRGRLFAAVLLAGVAAGGGCTAGDDGAATTPPNTTAADTAAPPPSQGDTPGGGDVTTQRRETIVLAGGCFWGMEELLRKIPGVLETEVGYCGGEGTGATYAQVRTGTTGHAESVRVIWDPARLSLEDLLGWFFRMHDPTTRNRQGNDIGTQYRSAILWTTEAQRDVARKVMEAVDRSGRWKAPLVTELREAGPWSRAEDYHQDYLQKNPDGYTCHWIRDP